MYWTGEQLITKKAASLYVTSVETAENCSYLSCHAEILVVSLHLFHVVTYRGVVDDVEQGLSFLKDRFHC